MQAEVPVAAAQTLFGPGTRGRGTGASFELHGAEGAPLAIVDATAGYRWRSLRADLEVENILDLQMCEGEYHYASHWRPGEEPSAIAVLHYAAGPALNARLGVFIVF